MFYLRHVIFLTNGSVRDKLLLIFCVTETGEGQGRGGIPHICLENDKSVPMFEPIFEIRIF